MLAERQVFFYNKAMDEKETKYVISLMSGTSTDSIDVGYCKVTPDLRVEVIDGINYPYPENVKAQIFNLYKPDSTVKELCRMNFVIGESFAAAAKELIKKHGKPDFISSHGQTVYHIPANSTLQIGESSVIASRTECMTISNFREKDIAVGGQGAPLVCFADDKWFRPLKKNLIIQNIGGISNSTVILNDIDTFGFDNGPGNMLIDYCMRKFFDKEYDKDGLIALEGTICDSWLNILLEDEYYLIEPPKTTGREYFSEKYIENALKFAPEKPEDIISTLTALTAKSIAVSYERYVYTQSSIDEVILGGGGAYNPTLVKYLRHYLPKHIQLKTHEDYGISNNFKEVAAFALLGYCTFYNIPNNLPSCTGAKKRVVLGKITY